MKVLQWWRALMKKRQERNLERSLSWSIWLNDEIRKLEQARAKMEREAEDRRQEFIRSKQFKSRSIYAEFGGPRPGRTH